LIRRTDIAGGITIVNKNEIKDFALGAFAGAAIMMAIIRISNESAYSRNRKSVVEYDDDDDMFDIEDDNDLYDRNDDADYACWQVGGGEASPIAEDEKNDCKETQFIGNTKYFKFHRPECVHLPSDEQKIIFKTYRDAVNSGYAPCKYCRP
jgi:hypothetical protein